VSADALDGLADLRAVHLDRNRVRTLDVCLVAGRGRPLELTVTGNPIACTCEDGAWLRDASVTLVGECWEPASRRGLPLARFNATACPPPPRGTEPRCTPHVDHRESTP